MAFTDNDPLAFLEDPSLVDPLAQPNIPPQGSLPPLQLSPDFAGGPGAPRASNINASMAPVPAAATASSNLSWGAALQGLGMYLASRRKQPKPAKRGASPAPGSLGKSSGVQVDFNRPPGRTVRV